MFCSLIEEDSKSSSAVELKSKESDLALLEDTLVGWMLKDVFLKKISHVVISGFHSLSYGKLIYIVHYKMYFLQKCLLYYYIRFVCYK